MAADTRQKRKAGAALYRMGHGMKDHPQRDQGG